METCVAFFSLILPVIARFERLLESGLFLEEISHPWLRNSDLETAQYLYGTSSLEILEGFQELQVSDNSEINIEEF